MTTATSPSRRQIIEERLAASDQYKGETRTLNLRGGEVLLNAIKLPVDLVLLNPASHRIKSQLESLSRAQREAILGDPYGPESQKRIEELVRGTDGYAEVRAVLANEPQREPGIVTREGILINANTRVAALRELGRGEVLVIVLPPDVTPREILNLEYTLQMQRESKQAYSFTNQLLFVEDLAEAGVPYAEIGAMSEPSLNAVADKKKAEALVHRELRLLALIRRVIDGSDGKLALTWFDQDRRQAMLEIDQDYEALVLRDPGEAARVRDAQLAAMMAGIHYRQLRKVDAMLIDDYLPKALADQPAVADHAEALLEPARPSDTESESLPAGLDLLLDDEPASTPSGGRSVDRIYRLLATSGAEDDVDLPCANRAPATRIPRHALVAAFARAVEVAIDHRKRDSSKVDQLTAPKQFLEDAVDAVDKAKRAHFVAIGRDPKHPGQRSFADLVLPAGYDVTKVREGIAAVRRALDDLEAELP